MLHDIKEKLEDSLDKHFPKGQCKERGPALVMFADAMMIFTEHLRDEKEFILNVLEGIDIADKQMGNTGGGTAAIRLALKSRGII